MGFNCTRVIDQACNSTQCHNNSTCFGFGNYSRCRCDDGFYSRDNKCKKIKFGYEVTLRMRNFAYKREYSDMYSKHFDDAKQMLEYGLMRQNVSSVLGVKVVSIEEVTAFVLVKIHVAM